MSSFLPFHGFSYTVALELAFRIQKNTTVLASFYYWGGGGGADGRTAAHLRGPLPRLPDPYPSAPYLRPFRRAPSLPKQAAGESGTAARRDSTSRLPATRRRLSQQAEQGRGLPGAGRKRRSPR